MNYTLIKIPDNFILCSGDNFGSTIISGCYVWHREFNDIGIVTFSNSMGECEYTPLKHKIPIKTNAYKLLKVIASLHEIKIIPLLSFSDEVAKEIGFIDEKKASGEWIDRVKLMLARQFGLQAKKESLRAAFEAGYIQRAVDSGDSIYSEKDLEFAFDASRERIPHPDYDWVYDEFSDYYKYRQSLVRTQWNVEVQMSHFDDLDMITPVKMSKPKITNNTITVTKIIA